MIRLGKLYIHFLTIAMFAVFILNSHISELACAYISMLLHETSHLIAAKAIGLRVSHIALYPFGVNLKLKNKMVANISDEMILYLSGPLTNLIIASAAVCFGNGYLYYINVLLFLVNMLPVAPLDGGCIVKGLISAKIGTIRAGKVMKAMSIFLSAVLIAAGVYSIYITGYNYSILLLAVFVVGNVFAQKEKYNTEYLRELMFYKEKPINKVKLAAAYCDENERDIAKKFMPGVYSVVCRVGRDGKIERFNTETEIIEKIFKEK